MPITKEPPKRTMHFNHLASVLWLHVHRGKEPEVGYFLDEVLPRIEGVRAFDLTKIITRESYHVVIGPGDAASCQCKGFTYRQRCKHEAALRVLTSLGKL